MNKDIWIFLFFLGAVLFSWPIISMFGMNLSGYLFLAWFVFIVLIYIVIIYVGKRGDGG